MTLSVSLAVAISDSGLLYFLFQFLDVSENNYGSFRRFFDRRRPLDLLSSRGDALRLETSKLPESGLQSVTSCMAVFAVKEDFGSLASVGELRILLDDDPVNVSDVTAGSSFESLTSGLLLVEKPLRVYLASTHASYLREQKFGSRVWNRLLKDRRLLAAEIVRDVRRESVGAPVAVRTSGKKLEFLLKVRYLVCFVLQKRTFTLN